MGMNRGVKGYEWEVGGYVDAENMKSSIAQLDLHGKGMF